MTSDFRQRLAGRFREQERFADGYSPLYAALFDVVVDWLAADNDSLADWLVEASRQREPLEVTLLLAAGIHREVLRGTAAALAGYYSTAGGMRTVDTEFPAALRATVAVHRARLAGFIRQANVQTNETGRGVAWLLPLVCLGWPAVHLLELGASAGLNLVAERRGYRLADDMNPARTLLTLGEGPAQFTILAPGAAGLPSPAASPAILSRTGGDMLPFHLRTAEDELTLAAFIWGDQPQRMARLREGIAALRDVAGSAAPVSLRPLRLPDELPAFLVEAFPAPAGAPVVIFNTTVSMYLPDKGDSMRGMIDAWASAQSVPVLWLQWEPDREGRRPPEREWLAWTADYWPNDGRADPRRFRLGWVHPHGAALQWAPDWGEFLRISMHN
ncbi:MAG: DUF2332 domain-containing protein [Candidatus Promineofilum sp.]|nr:DUF2332 domain-containing protein [Promineifilum sp.]